MIPVKIWGCRGSIPTPLRAAAVQQKIIRALELARGVELKSREEIERFVGELPFEVAGTYGGNTSCIELATDCPTERLILDAGSGLKSFSEAFMMSDAAKSPCVFHIVMSHPHWDHIQGFPFFGPAYVPGNKIYIYGYHQEIERLFKAQMNDSWFPVGFESFKADIVFRPMEPESPFEICGFQIRGIRQNHPGVAFGYRFEKAGKAIIYSTDSEHVLETIDDDYPFLEFFEGADLLIFDAQYTLEDNVVSKQNWGHSNNFIAVELAVRAQVKQLMIFHHDPANTDENLGKFLSMTEDYMEIVKKRLSLGDVSNIDVKLCLAYDGQVVNV